MNFAPPAGEALSNAINALINAALMAKEIERGPKDRKSISPGLIGSECERQLAYYFHNTEKEPFDGGLLRRFRMGHMHEDETASWLRLAGFDLRTHDEEGKQFAFRLATDPETGKARFGGKVDGFIVGGPDIIPSYPCGWENKIMASSVWRQVLKHGIKEKNYRYYAQMQIYMRQWSLKNWLFTALNTDTSELLFEIVDYNEAEANALIEKAARIIESKAPEELPRVAANEMDFRCKWCPFKAACWTVVKVEAPARPAWLGRVA